MVAPETLAASLAAGTLDIDQGVIVQKGRVIGVEAAEGTDALMERCAPLLAEGGGGGGVLAEARRSEQDTRVDLPTIGPRTVANAARAGLAGIAVGAGRALDIDADTVAREADAAGLFVVGVEESE